MVDAAAMFDGVVAKKSVDTTRPTTIDQPTGHAHTQPSQLQHLTDGRRAASKRRRIASITCLLAELAIAYAIWSLITLVNVQIDTTRSWDAASGLLVQTTACDIRVTTTTDANPYVTTRHLYGSGDVTWTDGAQAHTASSVSVRNSAGCDSEPSSDCSLVCSVTVGVPPSASTASLLVRQGTDDRSYPLLSVAAGVTLGSLTVCDISPYCDTLRLDVTAANISALVFNPVDGDTHIRGATIGSLAIKVRTSGAGSVYLLDVPSANRSSSIDWRQASNQMCLVSNANTTSVAFEASDPWTLCDIGQSSNTVDWSSVAAIQSALNPSRKKLVSRDAMAAYMSSLKCCEASCPYASNCKAEADAFYPPVDLFTTSRYSLPETVILANIYEQNTTYLVPGCHQRVSATYLDAATEAGAAVALGDVSTEAGEIFITIDQDVASSIPSSANADSSLIAGTTQPVQMYKPAPTISLRINGVDMAHLSNTHGASLGDVGSVSKGVVYIDAISGYDLPAVRFVYVVNAAHAIFQQPVLAFLSASLLVPPLYFERARFIDGPCDSATLSARVVPITELMQALAAGVELSTDQQHTYAALQQMHAALKRALRSNPASNNMLRGQLLIQTDELDAWGGQRFANFPMNNGITDVGFDDRNAHYIRYWSQPWLRSTLITAAIFSAIVGVVLGLLFTFYLRRVLAHMWHQRTVERRAKTRMLLVRNGYGPETVRDVMTKNADSIVSRDAPFEFIVQLIDDLIVEPMRRRLCPSVSFFLVRRCEPASNPGAYVYLRKFFREYNFYCFIAGLDPVADRDDLQRQLINAKSNLLAQGERSLADLRVESKIVRRIYGLRWRHASELGDDADDDTSTADVGAPVATEEEGGVSATNGIFNACEHRSRAIGVALGLGADRVRAAAERKTKAASKELLDKDDVPPEANQTIQQLVDAQEQRGTGALLNFPVHQCAILRVFIHHKCVVTGRPTDWIDLTERMSQDGVSVVEGFQPSLAKWCLENGLSTPALIGDEWAGCLPQAAGLAGEEEVRTIHGLRLQTRHGHGVYSLKDFILPLAMYAVEAFRVAVLLVSVLAYELCVIAYLLYAQNLWARTAAPGRNGLLMRDVFSPLLPGYSGSVDKPVLPFVQVLSIEAAVFFGATVLYAAVQYTKLEVVAIRRAPRALGWRALQYVLRGTRIAYGLFFQLHVFANVAFMGTILCWVIFAAVIEPGRYLPHGVAVTTIFYVAIVLQKKLQAARDFISTKLRAALNQRLRGRMALIKLNQQRREYEKALAGMSAAKKVAALENFRKEIQTNTQKLTEANDKTVTPTEVFDVIDVDKSGVLTETEFDRLLDSIGFPNAEDAEGRLFAYCDLQGKGTITRAEFEDGWKYIVDYFLEASLAQLGCSRLSIMQTIFTTILALLCFFAFILFAIAGWWQTSDLASVVQSILIGVLGKAVTWMRVLGKAEQAKNKDLDADNVVGAVLSASIGQG